MSSESVSRLELEELALGVVPADRASELARLASEDPALQERMSRVRSDVEAARDALPPLPAWLESADGPASPWRGRALAGVGAALALAAGVLVWVMAAGPGPEVRFRGGFDLEVERVRDGLAVTQGLLVNARPGDRIQYVVTPEQDGVLAVVDLQDDGERFTWWGPAPVEAQVPVRGAAVLDGYDGAERVFFLFDSDGLLTEAEIADAVERVWRSPLADLDALPLEVSQRSILVVRP